MSENEWMCWLELPEVTQLDFSKRVQLLEKTMEQWAGILVSSHSSETGPVLSARDTAVDKTVHAHRELQGRPKTVKFLDNRGQVVMNTVKINPGREQRGVQRPFGGGKV